MKAARLHREPRAAARNKVAHGACYIVAAPSQGCREGDPLSSASRLQRPLREARENGVDGVLVCVLACKGRKRTMEKKKTRPVRWKGSGRWHSSASIDIKIQRGEERERRERESNTVQ